MVDPCPQLRFQAAQAPVMLQDPGPFFPEVCGLFGISPGAQCIKRHVCHQGNQPRLEGLGLGQILRAELGGRIPSKAPPP